MAGIRGIRTQHRGEEIRRLPFGQPRPGCHPQLAQQRRLFLRRRLLPPRGLRLPRFLQELPIAKGDGRYGKLLTTLAKTDVLILDDWGLAPFSEENRRDLLEIVEDRHDRRATIITSQLPVEHWHDALGDATLADAILDRLVHNAYKITLHGESMRKQPAKLTKGAVSD